MSPSADKAEPEFLVWILDYSLAWAAPFITTCIPAADGGGRMRRTYAYFPTKAIAVYFD
jgi:hypothetical protein